MAWQVAYQLSEPSSQHVSIATVFLKTRELFSHREIKGLLGGKVEQKKVVSTGTVLALQSIKWIFFYLLYIVFFRQP